MTINNNPFLSDDENTIANDYLEKGYIVGKIQEKDTISWIRKSLINIAKEELKIILDRHKAIKVEDIEKDKHLSFDRIRAEGLMNAIHKIGLVERGLL